jgi:hypothetical protein
VGARKRLAALCAVVGLLVLIPAAQAAIATRPLATWQTNGRVNAIMQIGGVTYVGGKFTQVMNHSGAVSTVSNLAAFNSSGNFTGWAPLANGTVKTFATDGAGGIIAGGSFTKIGTAGRPHIAEFLANGTLVDKSTFAATADGDVQALAAAGGTLFMGGQFATIDGQSRPFLGAVSLADGTIDSTWTPAVDGRVDDLAAVGGNVVAGGFFVNADGTPHAALAAFDTAAGALQAGWASPTTSPVVAMTAAADGSIYTGHFNNRLQSFTPTGSQSWHDTLDGNVQALTVSDGELIAGGHFVNICVGSTCTVRHHIAGVDLTSGALDTTWAPNVNSDLGVFALADTSVGLAAGGDFTTFGGTAQAHLAFLATGGSVQVDHTPPTVSPLPDAILRKATTIASGQVPLLVRWGAGDPSGVCSYQLQRRVAAGPFQNVSLAAKTATTESVSLQPATTHTYRVKATDCVANASSFAQGPAVALTAFQDSRSGIAYTRAWSRAAAAKAYGGTIHSTSKAGAFATRTFTARQVAWVATRTATRGSARVYLDGKLAGTVNLHSATAMHRRLVFAHAWASDAKHTIKIVCVGTPGHATIDVDAILTVK